MKSAPSPSALNLRQDPSQIQKQQSTQTRASKHTPSFNSNPLLTVLCTASLEYAIQNALKNFLPRLESTTNARAEFYNRFKREADEYDNDFLRKYRGDLETTLIFVGLPPFFFAHFGGGAQLTLGNRLVCSPQWHPLSSSPFRSSSNRITHN